MHLRLKFQYDVSLEKLDSQVIDEHAVGESPDKVLPGAKHSNI
jgi:hypothetical protein